MKRFVIALLVSANAAFAGNGSGTLMSLDKKLMGPNGQMMALENRSVTPFYNGKAAGIVYYQGETQNHIYFQYGRVQEKQWQFKQFYAMKYKLALVPKVQDAVQKSKVTKDWATVETKDLRGAKAKLAE